MRAAPEARGSPRRALQNRDISGSTGGAARVRRIIPKAFSGRGARRSNVNEWNPVRSKMAASTASN
jgi:hypothetical protein